jgi:hypothetical protein
MKTKNANKFIVLMVLIIAVNYVNAASTLTCTAADEGAGCGDVATYGGQLCKSAQCVCVASGHPLAAHNYPDKCDATGKIVQKIEACGINCCYVTKQDCGDAGCENGACKTVAAGGAPAGGAAAGGAAEGAKSGLEEAGFIKEKCQCTCNTKPIDSVGIYKPSSFLGITTELDPKKTAKGKCQEQCAKTCGGKTTCDNQTEAECTTCCDTFCTGSYVKGGDGTSAEPGKTVVDLCKTSCKSTCKFKGTINGITGIIYMIAGMLGALMIAIHGIRMVTSQDPHDRDSAKSSILHVIIALIIIAMAAALVDMFISMGGLDIGGTSDSGSTPPAPTSCGVACTGKGTYKCADAQPTGFSPKTEGDTWCNSADNPGTKGARCYCQN